VAVVALSLAAAGVLGVVGVQAAMPASRAVAMMMFRKRCIGCLHNSK
jgi:hypothetical protein